MIHENLDVYAGLGNIFEISDSFIKDFKFVNVGDPEEPVIEERGKFWLNKRILSFIGVLRNNLDWWTGPGWRNNGFLY